MLSNHVPEQDRHGQHGSELTDSPDEPPDEPQPDGAVPRPCSGVVVDPPHHKQKHERIGRVDGGNAAVEPIEWIEQQCPTEQQRGQRIDEAAQQVQGQQNEPGLRAEIDNQICAVGVLDEEMNQAGRIDENHIPGRVRCTRGQVEHEQRPRVLSGVGVEEMVGVRQPATEDQQDKQECRTQCVRRTWSWCGTTGGMRSIIGIRVPHTPNPFG